MLGVGQGASLCLLPAPTGFSAPWSGNAKCPNFAKLCPPTWSHHGVLPREAEDFLSCRKRCGRMGNILPWVSPVLS